MLNSENDVWLQNFIIWKSFVLAEDYEFLLEISQLALFFHTPGSLIEWIATVATSEDVF